jgi:hypothetical protein
MKRLLTKALLLTVSLNCISVAHANEILQPFTDEMAEALGMTLEENLEEESNAEKLNARQLSQVLKDNKVVIVINKAAKGPDAQTMTIYENGVPVLNSKVSTGKEERVTATSGRTYVSTTPLGFFRPTKAYVDYLSYTWNAPMPNAVFFVGGIAIHATGQSNYRLLGSRASGGCVRTTLEDSKTVREIVMDSGRGTSPGSFRVTREAAGRNIVTGNTVQVPRISRNDGSRVGGMTNSWDTVIYVHQ